MAQLFCLMTFIFLSLVSASHSSEFLEKKEVMKFVLLDSELQRFEIHINPVDEFMDLENRADIVATWLGEHLSKHDICKNQDPSQLILEHLWMIQNPIKFTWMEVEVYAPFSFTLECQNNNF